MDRRVFSRTLIAVMATAAVPSFSFAQPVEFEWTPEHERTIYGHVTRERVRREPRAGFNVEVGGVVPDDVELYDMPGDVEYAPVRRYRYTVHENRVYVVEPGSRKVIRVIRR